MQHQSDEEDDEEVMREPEHFKIGPANDFHGGGNDEDEGEGDDHTRQSCDRGEHHNGLALWHGKENGRRHMIIKTKITLFVHFVYLKLRES